MTDKDKLLQTKTRYVNKIKEVNKLIEQLEEERKEYKGMIKDCDNQLKELIQPSLFT